MIPLPLRTLFFGILLLLTNLVSGQKNKISLGSQIPLNYCVAYEEYIAKGIYANYHFGYLSNPYVKVLFEEAEKRGLDPKFSELIEGYFQRGISHQIQLKYAPTFFKGFYGGASFKRKNIRAIEIPYELAADEFNIDLSSFDSNPLFQLFIDDLDFNISMDIPGIFVGRTFKLGDSRWSFFVEAAFHKIISSTSLASFTGSKDAVPLVNEPLNEEVQKALEDDGDIYSVNIGVSYTLPISFNRAISGLFQKEEKD